MERDLILRYSDASYLSKEEIKKALNFSNIDHIWEEIENYRKNYRKSLDLFSLDKKPFSVCLTNGISNRVLSFERRLTKIEKIRWKVGNKTHENALKNILKLLVNMNDIPSISDAFLEDLIAGNIEEVPQSCGILQKYLLVLKEIEMRSASPFNENTLRHLYSLLVRGERNFQENFDMYRSFDLNGIANVFLEDFSGNAPKEKIPLLMEQLFDFANESNFFPSVLSAITMFYILYYEPFECFNEEMAILSMKYLLSHEEMEVFDVPFERFLPEFTGVETKKVFAMCRSYQDVTYFLNFFIGRMENAISELESMVQKDMEKQIVFEDLNIEEENKEKITVPFSPEMTLKEHPGLTYEKKVSMPIFPQGLDEEDIAPVVNNLLEMYPSLKKGQAEFYARHCTIGKYYTIQQYKEKIAVAYETARTSMDGLAELGLYKKEKIRNKFVYTPLNRT